jgi:hypothetical protein
MSDKLWFVEQAAVKVLDFGLSTADLPCTRLLAPRLPPQKCVKQQ